MAMSLKPSHIGYLVRDMEKATDQFRKLGYSVIRETVYDSFRDIDICFMENSGYVIELIVPRSEKSVVAKLAKKIGCSPYHICYHTADIDAAFTKMRESGFVPAEEKMPAPAIDNHDAAFFYHPQVGIVELVEMKDE